MKRITREHALASLELSLDSDFLRALCEPARVKILRFLIARGACDIQEIAEQLPQERSVISRHLKILKDAGLLRMERDGRHRIYSVAASTFVTKLENILSSARACIAVCCPAELQ